MSEQKNKSNQEPKEATEEQIKPMPIEESEEEQEEVKIEHYEMLYIVPISYSVDELKPVIDKIAKLIKEQDGEITLEDDLGKLKLAYPIKQQSHGHYQLFEFDLPKNNLKKLNDALSLANEILRFLIVKKKIKTAKQLAKEKKLQDKLAKKKEQAIEEIKAAKEEPKEKPKEEKTKKKVSLEDLDKKLDEILDTEDMV